MVCFYGIIISAVLVSDFVHAVQISDFVYRNVTKC